MSYTQVKDCKLALFFVLIALSWPAQVIFQSPVIGGIAYLPLFIAMAFLLFNKEQSYCKGLAWIDIALLLIGVLVLVHALKYSLSAPDSFLFQTKWGVIIFGSGMVYIYVSRYASLKSMRLAAIAIFLVSVFFAIHWIYEAYSKTVLHQISWYAFKAFDYIKIRNGIDVAQVNNSLLGIEYRAYGLLDKHTTTAAYVALGFFSSLFIYFNKGIDVLPINSAS